jgi:hypothetical protein
MVAGLLGHFHPSVQPLAIGPPSVSRKKAMKDFRYKVCHPGHNDNDLARAGPDFQELLRLLRALVERGWDLFGADFVAADLDEDVFLAFGDGRRHVGVGDVGFQERGW